MYFNILKMSLRALKENTVRSVLTALGIIVGTAIVVIVLSVGQGVKSLILQQIANITADTLYIEVQIPSSGTRMEKDSNTGQGIATGIQITTLTTKDTEDAIDLPNISTGYSMIIGQNKMTYKNNEKSTMYWAVDANYAEIENLELAAGRFYDERENDSLSRVVVLGSEINEKLFGREDAVDKNIKINKMNFKVVGVAKQMGMQMFMDMDNMVYIPIKTAQKKLLGQDHIQAMALKMIDPDLIKPTISQLEKTIRKNHNIKDPEKDDFVVRTMDESMEMIDSVTGGISILLFAIACISLVVGGVGIMNIMYVSVIERTNEIGLKKALGAKPFAIRFQFIVEAVVISVIGGILGALLGAGFSWLVSFVAGLLNFSWPFVMPASTLIIAISISSILGVAFGYAPAKQAAELNPIDALKKA